MPFNDPKPDPVKDEKASKKAKEGVATPPGSRAGRHSNESKLKEAFKKLRKK